MEEQFLKEGEQFLTEIDQLISQDTYKGKKFVKISLEFYKKYEQFIRKQPYSVETSFETTSTIDVNKEDLRIIDDERLIEATRVCKMIAQVYVRLARSYYLLITYKISKHNEESDRTEPVRFARRALRYDPCNLLVCETYMLTLGYQNSDPGLGSKEKTRAAHTFHRTGLRCVRLNPDSAVAHQLLGRFYFTVASLSWLERTVANTWLNAKLEGSLEDAEKSFKRAQELATDWPSNGLWLARVCLALKKPKEEVKHWIDFGLSRKSLQPFDEVEKKEMLELKSKLNLSN